MISRGSQSFRRRSSGPGTSRRWALSCALALGLLASLAHPRATMAAGESDATTGEGEQAARRHYAQGDAAFKAGRYDEALKEFEAGYAASRRPGFLLNMAHTERKLGHLREARALYKKYLLVDPTSKLRDETRAVIDELDSALADEDRAERDRQGRDVIGRGAADDAAVALAVPSSGGTAVPKAPPPPADRPTLLQQSAGPAMTEPEPESPPFYRRAWFWVAVGAIALTGAGAAIYLSRRPGAEPFHDSGTLGSLGN